MANQRNTAVVNSVEEAEKIIQSNAYDTDFDNAVAYLQKHDPKNKVLVAEVKNKYFENDFQTLKALRALYRADEARANNDTAELERIAKFLDLTKNEELRAEALRIMQELPENPLDRDKAEAIDTMLGAVKEHAEAKENKRKNANPNQAKEMSDDEIFANANEINEVVGSGEFSNYMMNEIVKPSYKQVKIVDEEGNDVDEETSDNLWIAKLKATLHQVTMLHMDNADFAAMEKEEKIALLKQKAVDIFWADLGGSVGASAKDESKSTEENIKNMDEALDDFANGKPVKAKANSIVDTVVSTKRRMDEKAANLAKSGKNKSGSWLKGMAQRFGKFIKDYVGTPAEVKQAVIGYFSTKRGVWNTVAASSLSLPVALGALGASAAVTVPVALGTMVGYGLYHAVAPSQWTIVEKRNANLKLAKASGNAKEIKVWEGRAGLKHAYNAIQASPKEKERYDRQKRWNLRGGLGSAAIATLATPVILTGGLAGLGIGAAAALLATRVASSTARVASANTNAYLQMQEAIRQDKEDQTEESAKGAKRAKGAFAISLGLSGLAEYWMASAAFDQAAQESALGLSNTGNSGVPTVENTQNADGLLETDWGKYAQEHSTGSSEAPAAPEATAAADTPAVDWHEGITARQAQYITEHVQDKAAAYAKMFGWDVNPANTEEVVNKMAGNIQNAIDNGALPDKPVGEVLYKYLHLIAWREAAEPVSTVVNGKTVSLLQTVMVDGEPTYWTNAEEIKALNHIIFCNEKTNVSADALGHTLDRITASGDDLDKSMDHLTNNRYVGTADLDCNHVSYWERGKRFIRHIFKPAEEQQTPPPPPPPADAEVNDTPHFEDKPQHDANVNSGVRITEKPAEDVSVDDGAKVGTYSTLVKGTTKTTVAGAGDSFGNESVNPKRLVPGSTTNLGKEQDLSPAEIATARRAAGGRP